MEVQTTKKQGRMSRGWELTKSAWRVLRLDKEIAAIPLIGIAVTFLALLPLLGFGLFDLIVHQGGKNWLDGPQSGLYWLSIYLVVSTVSTFFSATIAHAAITRFRGGDPTVRSSLRAAWKRADSILLYGLFSGTIGYVLSVLEQKVPLAGRIGLWLVGTVWSIATFFAIPVIVTSDSHIGPVKSVRKSASLVKQAWGESVVSQFAIGLISLLATFLYLGLFTALVVGSLTTNSGALTVSLVGVGIIGFMALILVFSVLTAIAKAAVYHYATTGEAPESFNRELLQTAMTPKKARKLFV